MDRKLCFQPYIPGDEISILELFKHSYGGRVLPEHYWRWRFQDNPAGNGVIDLAWDGNVLAAHYAVTSLRMQIAGQEWLTGLSGTTMTHPNYRGQGLFPILARHAYERMASADMSMVWGFPNSLSHRGFIRDLNWRDIYEIPVFRLPLSEVSQNKFPLSPCVEEISSVDERFDRFWQAVMGNYDIVVRRDRKYLQWRYLLNPAVRYHMIAYQHNNEVQGYAIFKRYQDQLQVIDLLVVDDTLDLIFELMGHVINLAIKDKAASVVLWLNVTHPLHRSLEKIGFRPEGPVTYLGGLLLQPQQNSSIYDFRRWYFTMGDSDVF